MSDRATWTPPNAPGEPIIGEIVAGDGEWAWFRFTHRDGGAEHRETVRLAELVREEPEPRCEGGLSFGWYVGPGWEPESYTDGPLPTREAAIELGKSEFAQDGFSILEAAKGDFAPPTAASLMDQFLESWGEDDDGREDYPEFGGPEAQVKAAEADLDAALAAWFERHRKIMPTPWCFTSSRNQEHFPGEDEEAGHG